MVDVAVEGEVTADADRVAAIAQAMLDVLDRQGAELSIVLCDDPFIQDLNGTWRGLDRPTDVLSFPQDDPVVLGDIVVSLQTAARQAAELGHDLDTEVRALLAHGLLHLLGHDHQEPADTAQMRAAEASLLDGAEGLVGRRGDG